MKKIDAFEKEILDAYEKGEFKSTSPAQENLDKFKAAATATFRKDKRVNIRLSTPDLMDIQARALEQGMPYAVAHTIDKLRPLPSEPVACRRPGTSCLARRGQEICLELREGKPRLAGVSTVVGKTGTKLSALGFADERC